MAGTALECLLLLIGDGITRKEQKRPLAGVRMGSRRNPEAGSEPRKSGATHWLQASPGKAGGRGGGRSQAARGAGGVHTQPDPAGALKCE